MPIPSPGIRNILAAFPEIRELKEINHGGYKTVYKASLGSTNEAFKLVYLASSSPEDEERDAYRKENLARIKREIELLSLCRVPELVKLGSIKPRIIMIDSNEYIGYSEELINGQDLRTIIRHRGPGPDESESKKLMKCLLLAIKELWTTFRIVHRDIKPANIMKTANPSRLFVLLDLGIAFGLLDTQITRDPALIPCTIRYMPPEMAKPDFRKNLDFRSDLYSSALTVFEFSAHIHPLARSIDDPVDTISQAINMPPRMLKDEKPDYGTAFCNLVNQMLKKQPMLRPSNIDALIEQVEEGQ